MYQSMASILFGEESGLAVEIGRAIELIKQEVSTIKVRIAGDFQYPAKILHAFEIHIQRWLCLCKQQEDRSTINNRIINMDQVIKQILNSSLTIDLPTVFVTGTTNAAQKKEGETPTPAGAGQQQQGGEKRGKKCKGRSDDGAAGRHIKNKTMVKEFKMKEGRNWHRNLAGKLPRDRPKWGKNSWMCARWFTKGDCFFDCNNKECHVGAADISADKKAKYINFLNRIEAIPSSDSTGQGLAMSNHQQNHPILPSTQKPSLPIPQTSSTASAPAPSHQPSLRTMRSSTLQTPPSTKGPPPKGLHPPPPSGIQTRTSMTSCPHGPSPRGSHHHSPT